MKTTTIESRFVNELQNRVSTNADTRRQLDHLRQVEVPPPAQPGITLPDGAPYEAALDMVAADIEVVALKARLSRAEQVAELQTRRFWLAVYDHTDIDPDANWTFNSITGCIYRGDAGDRGGRDDETQVGSLTQTAQRYRELVRGVLASPEEAAHRALTPTLPEWLRTLAREVHTGDLKPQLRALIETLLDDPTLAQHAAPMAREEQMPTWVVELFDMLALAAGANPHVRGEAYAPSTGAM